MKSNNSNNTIMVHIRKLREKNRKATKKILNILKTVWGVGYKFEIMIKKIQRLLNQ